MAQDDPGETRPSSSAEEVELFTRGLRAAREGALRDPGASMRMLWNYRDYQLRNSKRLDPSGPGGLIDILEDVPRAVVSGHVITQTSQRERARAVIEAAGGAIDDDADEVDAELGVTRLRVIDFDATRLYDEIKLAVRDATSGQEPLAMSLDDVTCQNGPDVPGPIMLKSVELPGSSGAAQRVKFVATRPTGTGLGAGVRVAVIDGGFASETWPDGSPRPRRTDGWDDTVTPPADGRPALDVGTTGTLHPGAGHGTFVTGLVLRRAPDAEIRQYRATDSHGFGSSWQLKNRILQARDDGCRVINLSLGFTDADLLGNPALSAVLHHLPGDVIVVAAAGNAGTTLPMLPAAHKRAVGVGGLDADLVPVCWSNRGPWVDFSARAIPVTSTYVADPSGPMTDDNNTCWAVWAGTSFAAPLVAGELAVRLGRGMDVEEAVADLRATSVCPQPSPDFGYLLDLADMVGAG
ncbi:MAG: S8/S53 family peptidase [Tetrasphaera sp.]